MIILLAKLQWTLTDMTVNNETTIPVFAARSDDIDSVSAAPIPERRDYYRGSVIIEIERSSSFTDIQSSKSNEE